MQPLPPKESPHEFLSHADIDPRYNESITDYRGNRWEKRAFQSEFERKLTFKLHNCDKSRIIFQAYQTHLLPRLEKMPVAKELVEKELIESCFLLTCQKANRLYSIFTANKLLAPFQDAFEAFFSAVSCREHTHDLDKKRSTKVPRRIVIVTTSGGGGELMVANAMKRYLEARSLEIFTVDTRGVMRQGDALFQFSGISNEDIYSEVFQKANNEEMANDFWWKMRLVEEYVPNYSNRLLKERVKALSPDLILSTRWSNPEDVGLAYDFHVPLRFVHCDFRFSPHLQPLVDKVHASLVRFWIPSLCPVCLPKVAGGREVELVEVLGYPIRTEIKRESDPATIRAIKEKFGVQENEKVVLMTFGRNGVGKILLELIQHINSSTVPLPPLHVALICGTNASMQQELLSYIASHPMHAAVRFKVHGLLSAAEISDYYNIAHVLVGKSGGSTTAELIHMGLYGLLQAPYEWEEANAQHIVNLGLGVKMSDSTSFVKLLVEVLNREKPKTRVNALDWQERLPLLLQRDVMHTHLKHIAPDVPTALTLSYL